MRILLVDDSRAYHEEFAQLLKESGVSVEVLDVASSAVDGARLMAQDVHDIYFVDYRLPGDSGLALVKAARQAGVTKPIIILTGYDSPTIDAAAEAVGASDYLRKGEFSPPLLSRAIRYALRNVAALTMIREVESRFDVARDAAQAAAYHGALALVSSQMEAQVGHADLEVSEAVNAELRKLVEERTASLMRAVEQRRNAEDSLRQGEKLQAIGLLTGGIAHDFNNFLQIVLSGVALLRPSTLTEERRLDLLDKIGEAATNAVKFTDRMLAFARKRVLQPEAFDVDSRLAGMFDLLRPVLGSQIRLETDFAPEPWPVIADPHQLEVAILNLAINARDAMLPKGGTLCFQTRNVTLEATPERAAGDYVCLAVRDSGTGMSPATMARVFEPFFTTKASGRGTGLGLAQVYGFAKQSDGDVTIESTLEEGTTVFVHLPRHLSGVRGQAAVAWADDTAAWRDGAAVLPSGITRADR